MANKYAGIVQSGVNNFLTSAATLNGIQTDLAIQGIIGSVGNTSGVSPSTGSFSVNAQGSPNMTVAVSSGVAYVLATPTGGTAQSVRVTSDASENVTIAANATGGTRYDFVYIKVDPDKMNNPAVTGLDVVTLITQRSTTQNSDSNSAPSNSLLLAVVTVVNGAASISNSSINDARMPLGSWTPASETWTYSSADAPSYVITVPTDATGKYSPGMRVRLWQTTWKYFIITAVSSTTITVYGGTDYTLTNSGITNPMVSSWKIPVGFNADPAKWTVTTTSTSDNTNGAAAITTWYNLGSVNISVPIGSWAISSKVSVYAGSAGSIELCLSTGAATASDANLRSYCNIGGAAGNPATMVHLNGWITVAAKTTYYLNTRNNETGPSAIYNFGSRAGNLYIKAVCAYL